MTAVAAPSSTSRWEDDDDFFGDDVVHPTEDHATGIRVDRTVETKEKVIDIDDSIPNTMNDHDDIGNINGSTLSNASSHVRDSLVPTSLTVHTRNTNTTNNGLGPTHSVFNTTLHPRSTSRGDDSDTPDDRATTTTVAEMLNSFALLDVGLPPPSSSSSSSALALLDHAVPRSFEDLVRQKTSKRRAHDTATMATLQTQVARLEAALAAETKRRVQAVAHTRDECHTECQTLGTEMTTLLRRDQDTAHARWSQLDAHVAQLEARWTADVDGLRRDWDTTVAAFHTELTEVVHTHRHAQQAREVREAQLAQQLAQLSERYDASWRQERLERITTVRQIEERQSQSEQQRQHELAAYQAALTTELQSLAQELVDEQATRQQADETIVEALNQYTLQLQKSLALIVSDF